MLEVKKMEMDIPSVDISKLADEHIAIINQRHEMIVDRLLKEWNFRDIEHCQNSGFDILVSHKSGYTRVALVEIKKAIDIKFNTTISC